MQFCKEIFASWRAQYTITGDKIAFYLLPYKKLYPIMYQIATFTFKMIETILKKKTCSTSIVRPKLSILCNS